MSVYSLKSKQLTYKLEFQTKIVKRHKFSISLLKSEYGFLCHVVL